MPIAHFPLQATRPKAPNLPRPKVQGDRKALVASADAKSPLPHAPKHKKESPSRSRQIMI